VINVDDPITEIDEGRLSPSSDVTTVGPERPTFVTRMFAARASESAWIVAA
jgi:hypothetical protein